MAVALATAALGACHRAPRPVLDPARSPACADELVRERDAAIHIDGPYMGLPQRGDSVVIVANDREEWRGVYDPCVRPFPFRHVAPDRSGRTAVVNDTTTSLDIVRGRDAAVRFGIGTVHAVAYVVRTAPRHD